ncbi:Phosphate transport system permease protein PstC [Granulicella sibirica]|uniref:Phosphate transport system permease protein n=2 Tax=Granulicella sibirica TaxID=2479048 RepID=A0A4Q0T7G3_9BACT|nr:Phosphate transport system permease protein PstC [Granulicella sibirica]
MSFAERLRKGDEIAYLVTLMAALAILLITGLLAQHLWANSLLSRQKFGWHFLTSSTWDPVSATFGALPFVYGTLLTSVIGLVIAVPIGIGAAIFLSEMAPRKVSNVLTFLIELLAAVPSVIFGLIGIFVLVPLLNKVVPPITDHLQFLPIFKGSFYGVSYLTAGVVLSIMIVPFIVSISREVLMSVPTAQREAMMALGATKWDVTWRSVVPYARRGIIGSIFLALARALGETMAVTMVIGNVPEIHASLLSPGYTIAAVIANEFTEATDDIYLHALIEMALVLFVVTMIVNAAARLLMLTAGIREIRE